MSDLRIEAPPREARLISDAQTEIKAFCKKAVFEEYDRERTRRGIEKIVRSLLKQIDDKKLREECERTLPSFALDIWREFKSARNLIKSIEGLIESDKKQDGYRNAWESHKTRSCNIRERPNADLSFYDDPDFYNIEKGKRLYFVEYHRQVKETLERIVSASAKVSGDRINLRSIAEMSIRYDRQIGMVTQLAESGEDLVWIEPHANCSKRCERWQGKLYSISGKKGKIEGIPYRPLSDAMDITYTTKNGKQYKNGCITGYGCRHKLLPFRGKDSMPNVIPAHVVERQRAAEQQMRFFERSIRREKEKAIVFQGILPDKAKKARAKAKFLNVRYEAYAKKYNMPFVRERTRVLPGENIYKLTKSDQKAINSAQAR